MSVLVRGSYAPAHWSEGQSHLIDGFENGDYPLPPVLVGAKFVLGRASSALLEEINHVLKRVQGLVTNESAHELLHQVVDTVLRLQSREIACAAIFSNVRTCKRAQKWSHGHSPSSKVPREATEFVNITRGPTRGPLYPVASHHRSPLWDAVCVRARATYQVRVIGRRLLLIILVVHRVSHHPPLSIR